MAGTTAHVRELFARQVRARPNAVAVRFGQFRLSYAELNQRANRLAHHLRAQGVTLGSVVGVRLDHGPDLVVTLLAALKAGAAYLVVDRHGAARLRDCRVRVLVTTPAQRRGLPDTGRVVHLDLERPFIERRSPLNPVVPARIEDPAFIWYGSDEGVIVPHRTVSGLAASLPLDHRDVVPLHSPESSPGAALELWAPLCHGAVVAPCPPGEPLARVLARESATVAFLPVRLLRALRPRPDLGRLRMILTPHAGVSVTFLNLLVRALPEPRLVLCYCPAGCPVPASWHLVRTPIIGSTVPIGQSAGATRLRVLDSRGYRVAPEGTGEVFVAGDGVPLGSVDRGLALTRDPYRIDAGARMLRTGEQATVLPDGTLALTSRVRAHRRAA